ncbi:MAG TPA: alkaline phosphatase family protein [Terriglobales bacterium]|nr:alkaline phosphatase family protein [Terriglobales bacterium]
MGRKWFFYGVLGLLLILTACGGTGSGSRPGDPPGAPPPPPPTPDPPPVSLTPINHIIFMAQENRGFDHYFGHLNQYRASLGLPADVDGTPDNASNPTPDGSGTVTPFPMNSMCIENPSPFWNESHVDFNLVHPTSTTPTLDGFVTTAAGDAIHGFDKAGRRVMGYYDERALPYYYFMASEFATSDRWFSPVMTRTQPNRMYLLAGTSAGRVRPIPASGAGSAPLPNKTIFQQLDENHISWKIYITDSPPDSYLGMFTYAQKPEVKAKMVPVIPDYFNDLANGTLPQVAMIEGGYQDGKDEHPAEGAPGGSVQEGSHYVASLINGLMNSSSWKDSVFILTWDEGGGFYDHVAPQRMPSPDGIPPKDLMGPSRGQKADVCWSSKGLDPSPICDFKYTGFRVPLIVVSPFTKKHYVSHTVADYTAILRLIEQRFNLPNLSERDKAQMNMGEFFDFNNVPWRVPPVPPDQPKDGPCYIDKLP